MYLIIILKNSNENIKNLNAQSMAAIANPPR